MRFQFKVIETTIGTIEIGAENYEAALEEVYEAYYQDHVVWGDAEFEVTFDKSWEDE
jgi:hypothetical protein